MKYLHTMVRVHDLDESLGFYRDLLGLIETGRYESEEGRRRGTWRVAGRQLVLRTTHSASGPLRARMAL